MILHDIRFALRVLRRSPGFTALATLTLAIGIGATVTMFSVADAVLIRPVPYPQPDRLVQIWGQNLVRHIPFHSVSYPDVAVWRREAKSFQAMAAAVANGASLSGLGEPEMVQITRANAELLPMLGVTLAAGRGFLADEDRAGASPVAIISHDLWQKRFGAERRAIGETIKLDGISHAIVGVLPADFRAPAGEVDVFVPLANDGSRQTAPGAPPDVSVLVFARLKPGVAIEQAQAEMARISKSLDERFPSLQARNVRVWGLTDFRTRDVRVSLLVLAGAVVMVLLIACVNVANLLLARAGVRRGEIAVRMALGASRRRLVLQLLTESLIVGLLAGGLGVLLAYWGVHGLARLLPVSVPFLKYAGIDLRVLGFGVLTSFLAVVLFGLGPAFALTRPEGASTLQDGLKDQARGHGGRIGRRFRTSLVAAEVGLSLVLLVGASLLLQSFARLQQVNAGFNPGGVVTARIALNSDRYRPPAQSQAFFRQFLDEVQQTPGVVAAGITSSIPLSGHNQGTIVIAESGPITRLQEAPIAWFRTVSAGYFKAMGIPLLRGRLFDAVEERNMGTVIVNHEMATRYWPGEDPIGRRLRSPSAPGRPVPPWMTVVGVVGDVHHMALNAKSEPEMYFTYAGGAPRNAIVAVRTTAGPESLAPVLAAAARKVDAEQAVSAVRTLEEAVYDSTSSQRLSTTLLGLFAAIAVALAVVGLCGVTSYLVDQRTHEIGIRMALGARRPDVLRLVFRDGLLATGIGLALGLAGAAAVTRIMGSMLFGVSAWDPFAFAVAPTVLVLGAAAGILLPARRATRIDPLTALRDQ